ncbi:MAG: quaternary ammonium compound efflux SMR transporter SugE [Phycisphaeraceae bacterium]
MPWLYLTFAGLLEIVWAIGIKKTEGWTKLWPSVWTLAAMIASFWLLSSAIRSLPVGTAYAVWTGIGAAGTAIAGMIIFGESREPARWVCIGLIVAGIVGLKVLHREEPGGPRGHRGIGPTANQEQ